MRAGTCFETVDVCASTAAGRGVSSHFQGQLSDPSRLRGISSAFLCWRTKGPRSTGGLFVGVRWPTRSLIAQRLLEPLICLRHLRQLPQMTANLALETRIVIDACRSIVFLADQFLQMLGECGLLVRARCGHQCAANPFLGSRLVIVVLCVVSAPVRCRLIQLLSLEPALQPLPNLLPIPRLQRTAHHFLQKLGRAAPIKGRRVEDRCTSSRGRWSALALYRTLLFR